MGFRIALLDSATDYEKAVKYLDIYANITLLHLLNCKGSGFLRNMKLFVILNTGSGNVVLFQEGKKNTDSKEFENS